MSIIYTKNHFQISKTIIWDDVVKKISYECLNQTNKLIVKENSNSPTIILIDNFFPGTIGESFNEVKTEMGVNVLHLYISFAKNASTCGKHCDHVDVLIVQSIGNVSYKFDNGMVYNLTPGDSLFIPKGVYHEPIVHDPRVTLSLSWE
jgi:hypothetical protein